MFHKYPYTDFHELNLDYIMKLARESLGIHLEVVGNKLQLKNDAGDVISNVTISYATVAEKDKDGKNIEAYIYDAGQSGRSIVFTKGNNDTVVIPFPEDAITDKNGKDLTTYVSNISVDGDSVKVTLGNGTHYNFTVPFATKAEKDGNGKSIDTYMANVSVVGQELVFKDGSNVTLASITVPYATTAGEAEVAEKARKDINGNSFVSDYGRNLIVDGNKIGIEAHDGTDLNKITVPFASLSTNATNAIQTVTISGNNILFTTYGGQVTSIEAPYAVKALKDDLGNTIKSSYVANVVNDSQTGEITFLDAQGHEIVSIVPTVDSAVHDNLGNDLTDYIKTILTSPNSNYVTVTHGDGTVDTLTINYSTIAWKDTYGNAIGNTYCSLLTMGVDPQDCEPIVIGWNGETPKAEIFRLKVQAVSAQKDGLGNVIHQYYGHSIVYNNSTGLLELKNSEGTTISYVTIDNSIKGYIVKSTSTAGRVENINASNITCDGVYDILNPSGSPLSISVDDVLYEMINHGAVVYSVITYSDGTHGGAIGPFLCNPLDGIIDFSDVIAIVDPDNPTQYVTKYVSGFFTSSNNVWGINIITSNLEDTGSVVDNIQTDSNNYVTSLDVDGTTYSFTNDLETLEDVDLTTPVDGDVLVYDGNANQWINYAIPTPSLDLDDLGDVDVTGATDGQVLSYDATSQEWVPVTPSGGGGGSSALVVTLTGSAGYVTIDMQGMQAGSNITLSADKTYAEMKASDDVVFKIVDTGSAGSIWTIKPISMSTLNVSGNQALIFGLNVMTTSGTIKTFKLEIGPWSNIYTLSCIS